MWRLVGGVGPLHPVAAVQYCRTDLTVIRPGLNTHTKNIIESALDTRPTLGLFIIPKIVHSDYKFQKGQKHPLSKTTFSLNGVW